MNRTMENDWQFSNHLCQTSSKSSQATNMKNAKNSMLASRLRSSISIPMYADLLPIVMKKASYENTLFCHFYSLCINEENESDIWNNIALKNESNDGKYEKQSVQ